jgi:hypothetical protein
MQSRHWVWHSLLSGTGQAPLPAEALAWLESAGIKPTENDASNLLSVLATYHKQLSALATGKMDILVADSDLSAGEPLNEIELTIWFLGQQNGLPALGFHVCAALVANNRTLPLVCLPQWAVWRSAWKDDLSIWNQAGGVSGSEFLSRLKEIPKSIKKPSPFDKLEQDYFVTRLLGVGAKKILARLKSPVTLFTSTEADTFLSDIKNLSAHEPVHQIFHARFWLLVADNDLLRVEQAVLSQKHWLAALVLPSQSLVNLDFRKNLV